MKLIAFSTRRGPHRWLPLALCLPCLLAQGSGVLTIKPVETVSAIRGGTFSATLHAQLRPGYHVNSDHPADEFLIPLKLTWQGGPAQAEAVEFPKPSMEKTEFSSKPLSVFTGDFAIKTRFKVPANVPAGPNTMTGKLRYQACNNKECLPPKSLDVQAPVMIQ